MRLLKDVDSPLEGRHVLLVEDVVDTGLTLHFLCRTLGLRESGEPRRGDAARPPVPATRRRAPAALHRLHRAGRALRGLRARARRALARAPRPARRQLDASPRRTEPLTRRARGRREAPPESASESRDTAADRRPTPLTRTSKCRCGPVEFPVEPTSETVCALRDRLADADEDRRRVRVGGREPVPVVDDDEVAVAAEPAGVDDRARRPRRDSASRTRSRCRSPRACAPSASRSRSRRRRRTAR